MGTVNQHYIYTVNKETYRQLLNSTDDVLIKTLNGSVGVSEFYSSCREVLLYDFSDHMRNKIATGTGKDIGIIVRVYGASFNNSIRLLNEFFKEPNNAKKKEKR